MGEGRFEKGPDKPKQEKLATTEVGAEVEFYLFGMGDTEMIITRRMPDTETGVKFEILQHYSSAALIEEDKIPENKVPVFDISNLDKLVYKGEKPDWWEPWDELLEDYAAERARHLKWEKHNIDIDLTRTRPGDAYIAAPSEQDVKDILAHVADYIKWIDAPQTDILGYDAPRPGEGAEDTE